MKLDLACGNKKTEGFIGVDLSLEGTQADLIVDLEKYPWYFGDDSIDEIVCNHYIEHTSDLIAFMNEVHRILKPGGTATFVSPYWSSVRCWQDPTHKRAISEQTYYYFVESWRRENGLLHYPITANFEILDFSYHVNPDFQDIKGQDLEYAARHMLNVYDDIKTIIKKI